MFLVPLVEDAERANRPDGSDVLRVGWVAFSSHDETGDDLRRRSDDPDITWVDHTHPVVYAAPDPIPALLPGEYLVRVEPPALHRFAVVSRAGAVLFPWTRDRPAPGVGIPYVDYKRGDGVHIGPASAPWTPVLINAETSWVGTSAASGGWTPTIRSAVNAHPPDHATSATGQYVRPGRFPSAGPAWTRCPPPQPSTTAPMPG